MFLLPVLLLLLLPQRAGAQTSPANGRAPRINARIDESSMVTLRGNTHPLARSENDQGKVAPEFKLDRITMMFSPSAAQQADLVALLAAQQNPTSPSFHQWLTPAQYADRFGIAQSDLNQITAWLQAQGFSVVETPASRSWIVFSGTAAQVESALHTEIHNYAANGKTFFANSTEPSVPATLANITLGFRGLSDYPLEPRAIRKIEGADQPNFTSSISGNHFVAPDDFATIYDLKPLYAEAPAIDGTGQKIAIVGQSNVVLADIAAFRTASGLSPNPPTLYLVPGSSDPGVLSSTGDEQESSIDIEWSGAVARNATIVFVYANVNSGGVFDSLEYAIEEDLAPIISMSYGSCEPLNSQADINSVVAMAQQANALGITVVSSSGDGGATDCDGFLGNYPAQLGLNVDVPASLPYVTGVGGSEFNEGNGTYWNTTNNANNGSALSYIPEMAWDDSSPANGLAAGGGGASTVFGKPAWQTGTGVPADGVRDVPDISLNASPAHDPYLVCLQFKPSGSSMYTSSCLNGGFRYSDNSLQAYGGTSFGAPTFAGILALINQQTNSMGQGNTNYILYPLAASLPTNFHNITTGNNDSPCVLDTPNCSSGGPIGFNAGTGYDQATGLGSLDATLVVNTWSSITGSTSSTPTLSMISPTSATAGSASFTLTATGSNFGTNAQILWNGSALGVTMQPGGTSSSIRATISSSLVAYGTIASITVSNNGVNGGESSASKTFSVNGVPPVNDNVANAIVITSSNYSGAVDNSAATTEATDPTPPCVVDSTNPRTKTVWWTLTPASSETVNANTLGSAYDTTLSVWTGAPGNFTNVACNDDIPGAEDTQSELSFAASAGTKYYLMVAPFGPPETGADLLGGKTVLSVSKSTILSSAPPSQTVAAGAAATYTITNSGSVSYALTCSGLATGVSCGAVSVSADATGALVIGTTSRTLSASAAPQEHLPFVTLPFLTFIALGISLTALFALGGQRRRTWIPLGALTILLACFSLGCSGSGNGGSGNGGEANANTNPNGTPAGTYSIVLTGTASGQTNQITTVTLIVD